MVDWPQEKGDP